MKILVVVDMQNDFVTGSLKNEEAIKIVGPLKKFINEFNGTIIYTRDTTAVENSKGCETSYENCIGTIKYGVGGQRVVLAKSRKTDGTGIGTEGRYPFFS